MIKFVDMFSGIGGFREGLTRAGGFECVGHCEIDKYANRSYNALFDTKGEWFIEDARKADPSTMPDFQLLCGGFPCQTFSIAGSRKGFGDPRGTLFFELARLAEARKPSYLLFENVPGLLSHDGGRTFATILNTLDRLGYGVEWQCLNSKDFGVPQSRNRVYIVGYLDERCRGKVFPFTETAGSSLIQTHGGHQGERVYSPEGLSCTLAANPGGFGGKTGLYEVGVPIKCATKTGYQMAQVGDSIDLSYATVNSRRGRVGKEIAHDDREVLTLIENLIQNTTPSHSKSSDPFWEKSETALLQALMLYLLHEAPPEEQNFSMVMEMIAAAEVHEDDDNYQSPLDILFERLEMREPDSIACKQYRIFKQAAGKTAKSILVSVGVRLAAFNLPSIAKLTMTDELHLQELGERKIALFCCIPDSDKSLNYLVGMIYTQLIQTLYRQADRIHKGRLPVPVHCLMDEYANISLPKDTFLSALATMRSRAIFCSIIVQNMAQLKAMYKDDWESLVGLCDEFLYLGGTEKETHKYVSELLGKETISTTSYNQSKGRSGSYSINHQQSGRDLMTPDEVRLLNNSKCILFIRGERPVIDLKYNLLKHPNIRYTEDGGAAPYDYTAADNARDDLPGAPENYELLDMDDFLPAEAAEMKPTIQRIRRST